MASLNKFKIDSKRVADGDWISPGEEYDDLEIKTRGFTDEYTDARNSKIRRASALYNNDPARIPTAVSRAITVECMIKYVVQDVRNLKDANEQPVNFAQFCDMLLDPDYYDLVVACIKAAAIVGVQRAADKADAEKN